MTGLIAAEKPPVSAASRPGHIDSRFTKALHEGRRPFVQMRPITMADGPPGQVCRRCDARASSVCSAISDADLARLAAASTHYAVKKGQVFITEGEPATDFFNVTGGTAKLFKLLPDGRQQITGFAALGHFLGLAASDTYAFSAEAVEEVRLCRFSRPTLRRLLDDFPHLERRLLDTACTELAAAQDQLLLLGRKTAVERVASFLVAWSHRATASAPRHELRLPMTRGDIADYLGLTIETVSRTFSRFRADQRIATPALDAVVLIDLAWLDNVAGGNAAPR